VTDLGKKERGAMQKVKVSHGQTKDETVTLYPFVKTGLLIKLESEVVPIRWKHKKKREEEANK
jgi:hypothetical protein